MEESERGCVASGQAKDNLKQQPPLIHHVASFPFICNRTPLMLCISGGYVVRANNAIAAFQASPRPHLVDITWQHLGKPSLNP